MERIGLRVPPAFVLDTGFCRGYFARGRVAPPGLRELLAARIRDLERASGLVFGSARRPLLVSVRSGAPVSMPGMMDTVLDIGMCEATLSGLLRLTGESPVRLGQLSPVRPVVRGSRASRARRSASTPPVPHGCASSGAMTLRDLDFQALRALTRDYLDIFEDAGRKTAAAADRSISWRRLSLAVWASWTGDKGRRVPTAQRAVRRSRHGGHGSADGVRQRGRHVRRGGRVHARSGVRRTVALSRFHVQRARRGCGFRTPPRRRMANASPPCCRRSTRSSWRSASDWRRNSATCRSSSSRCRTASCMCCRRERASARPGPR